MRLLHTFTEDGLKLPGFMFEGGSDVGLLLIHGMGGNFLENPYAHILAQDLAASGISFLYGHNRGYSLINDMRCTERDANGFLKLRRGGRAYERFAECRYDVAAWLSEARKAGWKKIFIAGYSLGGPKLLYSLPHIESPDIKGLALLSAADMVGLGKKDANYDNLLKAARANVAHQQPLKLLEGNFWGEDAFLSSQTFLDLFEEGGPADVLPLYKKPANISALRSITKPLLIAIGELDDIAIDTIANDVAQMTAHATASPAVTTRIIAGAPHSYENREHELAALLSGWIKQTLGS